MTFGIIISEAKKMTSGIKIPEAKPNPQQPYLPFLGSYQSLHSLSTMQSTLFSPSSTVIPTPSSALKYHSSPPSLSFQARASATVDFPPPVKLNRYSSHITEPKSQDASQAVLYGVGLSEHDMGKPQVGVSSVWYEGNTCNMHLLSLSEAVKEGVAEAGMIPFRFNMVGVSDAISMGTRGMCYSLQSRDLIADSIEIPEQRENEQGF